MTQFYLHHSVPRYNMQEPKSAHMQDWINMQDLSCPRRQTTGVRDFTKNWEEGLFLKPWGRRTWNLEYPMAGDHWKSFSDCLYTDWMSCQTFHRTVVLHWLYTEDKDWLCHELTIRRELQRRCGNGMWWFRVLLRGDKVE
jgi:hypothetical protein